MVRDYGLVSVARRGGHGVGAHPEGLPGGESDPDAVLQALGTVVDVGQAEGVERVEGLAGDWVRGTVRLRGLGRGCGRGCACGLQWRGGSRTGVSQHQHQHNTNTNTNTTQRNTTQHNTK